MDLSKIISVAGKPGLYRILAQGRQALIVESLLDGKRTPVHSSVRVSSLEEISMFTTGDDVPLSSVLTKLYEVEKGGETIDPKSGPDALFAKLGEALPEHDRERIYASDVRKLFTWYGQLLNSGVFQEAEKEAKAKKVSAKEKAEKKPAAKGEEKPKKAKVAAKKAAAPKPSGSKPKATTMRKSAQRGG